MWIQLHFLQPELRSGKLEIPPHFPGCHEEIIQCQTVGMIDTSGMLPSMLGLFLVFLGHGASRKHDVVRNLHRRSQESWIEIVLAAFRLFLQLSLHHWTLAIPQSSEGCLKVVGNGTLLLCCFFHEPALELRGNTKIQSVTLYHF